VLLGLVATLVATAAAPTDPMVVGRAMYRVTLRARGGTFVSSPGVVLQSGATDCGPAALATLLRTLGGNPPPTDSLARLAGTGAWGTTFAGLARTARLLGVANELRRLTPAAMDALHTPVIAWVDGGHFVTVVPDSSRSVLVLDPAVGPYRIGRARLRRYWSGEALVPARTKAGPAEIPR
jgi:ABC-type bacteriocin/lantibiotic exporter with double-glycine peptidase domain